LLELEKVNDSTSGAKWIDIDGDHSLIVVTGTGSRREGTIIESAGYFAEGEGERE